MPSGNTMTQHIKRGRQAFDMAIEELDAQQSEFFKAVEQGPRGRVPINLRAWLHNMPFARVVEPFGLYVSGTAPIGQRAKEILILVNARHWDDEFEWRLPERHAPAAGQLGSASGRERSGEKWETPGG